MQNFKCVSNSFADTLHNSESISLKSVRLSRLCYIFAYALELVLFSVRGHFMPIGDGIFGLNGRTVAMAVHGIASLIATGVCSFKPQEIGEMVSQVFISLLKYMNTQG